MSAKSAELQARKQEVVRNAIWDTAIDLFADNGYDSVLVDDIAQAAGVSQRSFFRYFASKSDLMGQGIVTYGAMLTEAIRLCPKSALPMEAVRHAVLLVAAEIAAHPRSRKIIAIAAKFPEAREAQFSRRGQVLENVAKAFLARMKPTQKNLLTSRLLAGLTLTILDVASQCWFEGAHKDISVAADRVFEGMRCLMDSTGPKE